MIIPNGTIEVKQKATEGGVAGIDPETGYPIMVEQVEEWGEPIPCQYYFNSRDNLGQVSGESFTIATYTILVDDAVRIEGEQVRLVADSREVVGEYSIISLEELRAVGQTRILV